MEFCEVCGAILKIKGNFSVCNRCNIKLSLDRGKSIIFKEKVINSDFVSNEVSINKDDFHGIDFDCKKCDNRKGEVMDAGIRYSDEDWIYLVRCTKCGYTTRWGKM